MDPSRVGVTTLELNLLGGFELRLGGAPLKLRYPSAAALLAYLAVTNAWHHRASLADLLWGELPSSEAKANLRRTLSALRQELGELIELEGDSVALNRAVPKTDVKRFRTLLQLGEGIGFLPVKRLEAALALYKGDFLAGFTLPTAPGFDDWSFAQLEGFKELALTALRSLATQHLARRHDDAAIGALRRLVALDPWSEKACRQLLVLLAEGGHRDAAMSEFRRFRVRLDELGEEPSDAMLDLLGRLGEGTSVAELLHLPKHNLEVPATVLLGCEEALAQVTTLLTGQGCRLLTLLGPGGVGKTRLGKEVGWQVVGGFRDGVFFVSLAPVNDPDLVPGLVLQTLELEPKGGMSPGEQLTETLRDRQVLLILDNFEQVTEAAPFVAELLAACAQLKILVTSRVSLRLRGEQEVEVLPLPTPPQALVEQANFALLAPEGEAATLEGFLQYSSVALFCERTRAVRPTFVLDTSNALVVAQICRRLDGLPLAIELAAARSKLFPPAALLTRLNHRLGLLNHGPKDLPERHQTLRATLAWSFDLLSESEQRLFRRLGSAVGSCSLTLAGALSGEEDEVEVLATLTSLLDKSLLRWAARDDEPRVVMLETIREYALEKLAENPDEAQANGARHAKYFSDLLEQLYLPLVHADREARRGVEDDLENIRAAWLWAVAQREAETLRRLSLAFGRTFETRPLEAVDLFAAAAASLDKDTPQHRAALGYIWVMQAWLLNSLGQPERALHLVERGLELLEPLAEYPGLCKALSVKAWNLWFYKSNPFEAKRLWEASLALARQHGIGSAMGEPLAQLVVVELGLGSFEGIKLLADQTLRELETLGDRMQYAKVLCWLGSNLSRHGFLEEGMARIRESVQLARSLGLDSFLPVALGDATEAAYRLGADEEAEDQARECVLIARKKGVRYAEARGLRHLGRVMMRRGDAPEAQRYLDEALVKAWEAGDLFGVTAALVARAELSILEGKPERAIGWLTFVLHYERTERHIRREAQTQLDLLETQMNAENFARAAKRGKNVQLEVLVHEMCANSSRTYDSRL